MEVLNKIIPLILTAIMSVNLSGCGNGTGANGSQPAETSSSTAGTLVTEVADDYDPTKDENLKAPDRNDFAKITICGREFDMPCEIEDFDGDFSYKGSTNKRPIMFKNEFIGVYTYNDVEESDYTYCYTIYSTSPTITNLFTIGEFVSGPNQKYTNILEIFGRPTRISTDDNRIYALEYDFTDFKIYFGISYVDNETQDILFTYYGK